MLPRVLITRTPDRAQELMDELAQRGVTAFAVAVTQTIPLRSRPPIPDLDAVDWLVFSSQHAVDIFSQDLDRAQKTLPDRVQIAVVGPATGKAARLRLRHPDLIAGTATGAGLAETLTARLGTPGTHADGRTKRLLWPCARRTTPGLARGLRGARLELIPWPCYETVPVEPHLLRSRLEAVQPWQACVFAAPSAVRAFCAVWPPPWSFAPVAIGPTTAGALQQLGVEDSVVSDAPAVGALADAVVRALGEMPSIRF